MIRVHLAVQVISHRIKDLGSASLTAMNLQGITPSALAMRLWLHGLGRLQLGSEVDPCVDRIWLRPIRGGRWSVVHFV